MSMWGVSQNSYPFFTISLCPNPFMSLPKKKVAVLTDCTEYWSSRQQLAFTEVHPNVCSCLHHLEFSNFNIQEFRSKTFDYLVMYLICSLFNEATSTSDYIALNDKMISKHWIRREMRRSRGLIWANILASAWTMNSSQDSQSLDRDLNTRPPEQNAWAVSTRWHSALLVSDQDYMTILFWFLFVILGVKVINKFDLPIPMKL